MSSSSIDISDVFSNLYMLLGASMAVQLLTCE